MKPIQLAGCVIVDEQERVLLLHRSTEKHSHWELPGGKIEAGETAEIAAVREMHEELGVSVRIIKGLGDCAFSDGGKDYGYQWFHAEIIGGQPTICEPDIHDDLDYMDLDDMMGSSLSANMQILLEKFWSSEVVL